MNRLKKDDIIEVINGKDRGKRGEVLRIFGSKCVVDGINIGKEYNKRTSSQEGGIVDVFLPLDISNIMLVCTKCDQKTKVFYKILENKQKIRCCKKCKENI